MGKWYDRFITNNSSNNKKNPSFLRSLIAGSLYKMSDIRSNTSLADIQTQINTMRALARDSQIATALSYYATDATTTNSSGQIIWATPIDEQSKEVADIINEKFKQWDINAYARDHVLELATIGNLYIPTTHIYKKDAEPSTGNRMKVAIDNNTIPSDDYEIIPSYKINPEDVVHLYKEGVASGYMLNPESSDSGAWSGKVTLYPESSIIHFSLGGLLGEYTIDTKTSDNEVVTYDIKFAQPLMESAVQPTQTLTLLEDAMLLSSLSRVVKFINVDCGNAEEEEIAVTLQQIKDAIEQQLSINTSNGDAQSFVNPQSPNNLIYLPKINGADAISITDLNMAEATETDNKLLNYYQDKKLSVLGVPKEAMNFSSSEGLGGAGAVMSQRSALYANSLQRIETAYISGWTDAMNKYFEARNLSGFKNKFTLHMNPILTELSQVQFDKRDSALSQASSVVSLMKDINVEDPEAYKDSLTETLGEVFPKIGSSIHGWDMKLGSAETDEGGSDLL